MTTHDYSKKCQTGNYYTEIFAQGSAIFLLLHEIHYVKRKTAAYEFTIYYKHQKIILFGN